MVINEKYHKDVEAREKAMETLRFVSYWSLLAHLKFITTMLFRNAVKKGIFMREWVQIKFFEAYIVELQDQVAAVDRRIDDIETLRSLERII